MRRAETKLQGDADGDGNFQGDEISEQIFNNQSEMLELSREIFEHECQGDINLSDSLENSFFHTFVTTQKPRTLSAPINFSSSFEAIPDDLAQDNTVQFKSIQNDGLDFNNFNDINEIDTTKVGLPNDETLNNQRKETPSRFFMSEVLRSRPTQFYFSEFNKKNPLPAELVNKVTHEGKAKTFNSKFYIVINDVKTRVYTENQVYYNALFHINKNGKKTQIENPEILKTHYKIGSGNKVDHFVIINNQPTLVYTRGQAERKLAAQITKKTRERDSENAQDEMSFENSTKNNDIFIPIESTIQESTGDLAEEEVIDTAMQSFIKTYSDISIEDMWEGNLSFSDNLENSFFHTFVTTEQPGAPLSVQTNFPSSQAVISNELAIQANTFPEKSFDKLDGNLFSLLRNPNKTPKQKNPASRFYYSEFNKSHPLPANLVDKVKHEGKAKSTNSKFYIDNNGVNTRVYSESQVSYNALYHINNDGKKTKIDNPEILKTHFKTKSYNETKHYVIMNNSLTLVYTRPQAKRKLSADSSHQNTRKRNIEPSQDETASETPVKKMRSDIPKEINSVFTLMNDIFTAQQKPLEKPAILPWSKKRTS